MVKNRPYYYRPIGIFEAVRARKDIERYRQLIEWSHTSVLGDGDAKLINKMVSSYDSSNHFACVRRELSRMAIIMHRCFERVGLGTQVFWTTKEREYDFEKHIPIYKEKKHSSDIFGSGDSSKQIPDYRLNEWLDEADGAYERIVSRRLHQLMNPVYLASLLFIIPLNILEHAGVDTQDENTNKFVFWLMQSLMAILLLFIVTKLGLSIDFSDLLSWLKR